MEFLNFEGLAYFKNKENSQIAPVESTTTASQAYEIGQYFWYEGKLYEATAAIALGDTFVTSGDSANCELADIADDISDARERIGTLEGQVTDLETNKANIDGYYSEMTVGNAEQIVSTVGVEDKTPYNFRTAGGSVDIGDREEDMVVGGTVAWNQLVTTDTNVSKTKSGDIITVNDAVAGNAEDLVVSFEPQQDLHGQDAPYPAGGGKNKFKTNAESKEENGVIWTVNTDGTVTVSGTCTGFTSLSIGAAYISDISGNITISGLLDVVNIVWDSVIIMDSNNTTLANVTPSTNFDKTIDLSEYPTAYKIVASVKRANNVATSGTIKLQVEIGSSATPWKPYSNICPITGFTGTTIPVYGANLANIQQSTEAKKNGSSAFTLEYISNGVKHIPTSTGSLYCIWDTGVIIKPEMVGSKISANGTATGGDLRLCCSTKTGGWDNYAGLAWSFPYTGTITESLVGCHIGFQFINGTGETQTATDMQLNFGESPLTYTQFTGTTYPVSWQSEAGTVYGGTWNPVSGVLTVDRVGETINPSSLSYYSESSGVSRFKYLASSIPAISFDVSKWASNAFKIYPRSSANVPAYSFMRENNGNNSNIWTFLPAEYNTTELGRQYFTNNQIFIVYELATPTEISLTPQQIALLAGTNNVWNSIGSTQMTYLGTLNEITAQSGHKYLTRVNGSSTVVNGSGQTLSGEKARDNIFDLTQMFGSSIADYVYSLENTSAGDGVTWFTDLFPKPYYSYNAGQLMSVNTSAHKTVGFNLFNVNDYLVINNAYFTNTDPITYGTGRTVVYMRCLPNTKYCASRTAIVTNERLYIGYTKELPAYGVTVYGAKGIGSSPAQVVGNRMSVTTTTSADAQYIAVWAGWENKAKEVSTLCINLSWDGERDGEYEAYEEHTYALDESLTLRGIPKLDSGNKLYYDGDTYEDDGTVTRRFGVVDIGSLTWYVESNHFYSAVLTGAKLPSSNSAEGNIFCLKYQVAARYYVYGELTDKAIAISNTGRLYVYDSALSGKTATEFKTAMSGVYLVYELGTPTTEEADPYTNPQIVSDWGTEEYVDYSVLSNEREVSIPVGHVTVYQNNLRAKLEMAPESPSDGDGDYIVRQTNGENEYVKLIIPNELPEVPTEAGTYILQVTISSGTATYSWVSAT